MPPPAQGVLAVQVMSQPPQLLGSLVTSVQIPLQQVFPAGQPVPSPHPSLQIPSKQTSEQQSVSAEHSDPAARLQVPSQQTRPSPQLVPSVAGEVPQVLVAVSQTRCWHGLSGVGHSLSWLQQFVLVV